MKARWVAVMAGSMLSLASCASAPRPQPSAPLDDGEGLAVVLVWSVPVDLDLYLTDPTGETAYFGNPWTRSGSKLREDLRCGDTRRGSAPYREVAGSLRPIPGRYRVSVDFNDRCEANHQTVPFRLWVRLGGSIEDLTTGAQFQQLSANVIEFDVSADLLALRRAAPSGRTATVLPAARAVQASAR